MLQHVLHVARGASALIEKGLADVPDHLLTHQPPSLPNHPLWTIGHLTFVRGNVTRLLGADANIPESYAALFGPGSAPSSDAAKYPPKAELLAAFRHVHHVLLEKIATLTPAQLDAPNPIERIRHRFPTIGDLVVGLLVMHEGFHLGQLAAWRSVHQLPGVIV